MSRKTLTAALTSLAVVGALAVAQAQGPGAPPPGPGFGPELGPFGHGLTELLGLSAQQQAQLKAMRETHHEASKPLIESARQAREAFRAALEAESPDPTAVGEAALAMHAAEKELKAARQAAFEQMKSILTPDQLQKLEQARGAGWHDRRGPREGGQP